MKFIFCLGLEWSMDGHSGLYWGSIYFCGKNDVICCVIEWQFMGFLQKKDQKKFMVLI